eukprot:1151892-Pelagomonas_calceolata.AAC.4
MKDEPKTADVHCNGYTLRAQIWCFPAPAPKSCGCSYRNRRCAPTWQATPIASSNPRMMGVGHPPMAPPSTRPTFLSTSWHSTWMSHRTTMCVSLRCKQSLAEISQLSLPVLLERVVLMLDRIPAGPLAEPLTLNSNPKP